MKNVLSSNEYRQLADILNKIKLVSSGDDEKYGWEYAIQLASEYFDPLYLEYIYDMPEINVALVFTHDFISLYNSIAENNEITYIAKRFEGSRLLFFNDGFHMEAYGKNGELLCDGDGEDSSFDNFTGFRKTEEYYGEFVNGQRTGKGREKVAFAFSNIDYNINIDFNNVRREGIWKDNELLNGMIHSALLSEKNGLLSAVNVDEHGLIIVGFPYDNDYINSILNNPDDTKYFLADLKITPGKDEHDESNVRPLVRLK